MQRGLSLHHVKKYPMSIRTNANPNTMWSATDGRVLNVAENAHRHAQVDDGFKTCSYCQAEWENMEAFIADPKIELVGYMPTFDELLKGLFLFNHSCGTTLACRVGLFSHLYEGPVYEVKKTGQSECPGYCLNKAELSPCPVACNCAYVRETLQIIKKWPKD